VALGGSARVLSDRDAREGSREEEGQMHVELSFSGVVGKAIVEGPSWLGRFRLKTIDSESVEMKDRRPERAHSF
jgi:hypothetical protein